MALTCALLTGSCGADGEAVVPEPASEAAPTAPFATGLDALLAADCTALAGRRIGLVVNDAARNAAGEAAWELLAAAENVELARLYSPEHGLGADRSGAVGDTVEPATGLEIVSLYGERRAPDPAELAALDALVYDLPDVGVRFYTYTSTLYLCLEACREAGIPLVVLDRPNPLGNAVSGPLPPGVADSFVGKLPLPVRYGLTPGETARWIAGELLPGAEVEVAPLTGYDPAAYLDAQTPAPPWRPTSPNLPRLAGVVCYPGTGLFEPTNLSVGRGTERPFEVLGAPWLDAVGLRDVWTENCPGADYRVVEFTPRAPSDGKHAAATCRGVEISVDDRNAFDPLRLAVYGYAYLGRRHPDRTRPQTAFLRAMLGDDALGRVFAGELEPAALLDTWAADAAAFTEQRRPCLLYSETP